MLNKYLRSTSIVVIRVVLPVMLLLALAPKLMQFSQELMKLQHVLTDNQKGFFIARCIVSLSLFCLWPRFILDYMKRNNQNMTPEQTSIAITARWYLLAAIAVFELLVWWR